MVSKKFRDMSAKEARLHFAAEHCPWTEDQVKPIAELAVSISSEIDNLMTMIDAVAGHPGTLERKKAARMLRSMLEAHGGLQDVMAPIFSKFPDLAPEALRSDYLPDALGTNSNPTPEE